MSARLPLTSLASSARRPLSTSSRLLTSPAPSQHIPPPPPPPPFSVPLSSPDASAPSSSSSSIPAGLAPPPAQGRQPRIYASRKAHLYKSYQHLLERSHLVLLFKHDNLKVKDIEAIRRAIKAVKVPPPPTGPLPSPAEEEAKHPHQHHHKHGKHATAEEAESSPTPPERATLTMTRSGVFSAFAKTLPPSIPLRPYLKEQTALLTCPTLSPLYLKNVLGALNKTVGSLAKARQPAQGKLDKLPKLELVAGVMEGRVLYQPKQVVETGKLPELDTLRAQVVGLLEGQGRGLLGVVSQAGGGGLVRTLMGLEEGLKAKEAGGEEAK